VHATSVWGNFVTTRVWLAYTRQTPLQLMTFLEDAHKLGVLRQVGAVYQFRHALLQERLAGTGTGSAPAATPASTSGEDL
jgi:hypothetical protein